MLTDVEKLRYLIFLAPTARWEQTCHSLGHEQAHRVSARDPDVPILFKLLLMVFARAVKLLRQLIFDIVVFLDGHEQILL